MKVTKIMMSYLVGNEKKLSIETKWKEIYRIFSTENNLASYGRCVGLFWRTCNPEGSDHHRFFQWRHLCL